MLHSAKLLILLPIGLFAQSGYVGSLKCKTCHIETYQRWSKTRMANVVRDPKVHPDAIIPDLTKPDPLVKFTLADIAWVYGSKWKQRFFTKQGDDYFPLPAQWDVAAQKWRPAPVTPVGGDPAAPGAVPRPTSQLCDGCHSVNFDIETKKVTEWNVGCERCHGPGESHVRRPAVTNIINPARLDSIQANDVCIQCHSEGQPLKAGTGGHYEWPVGFHTGQNLKDFWKLDEYKLGVQTPRHFADGTAHKNRMQGNDFVQSVMYTHGVACHNCHDVHGTPNNADLIRPANVVCLNCHGPKSPNGPRGATPEEHTHHQRGSTGNECVGCHMPKIALTLGDQNVRSHTFRFIPPSETESLKVPNGCNSCHTDRSTDWAKTQLKSWTNYSPWRVAK